jgi:hypothetical protein
VLQRNVLLLCGIATCASFSGCGIMRVNPPLAVGTPCPRVIPPPELLMAPPQSEDLLKLYEDAKRTAPN